MAFTIAVIFAVFGLGVALVTAGVTSKSDVGEVGIDAGVALMTGAVLGLVLFFAQDAVEDDRVEQETRRDNVCFVREVVTRPDRPERPPFVGLDLRGADLAELDLSGANLTGADLTRANLFGATLTDATLTEANLTDANLTDADLFDADLIDADLADEDLSDGRRYEAADLSNANLKNADLMGADLSQANLTDADLSDTDLICAKLNFAILTDTDLTIARLTDADLTGANYKEANLTDAKGVDTTGRNTADRDQRCHARQCVRERGRLVGEAPLVVLTALALTGCGGDDSDTPDARARSCAALDQVNAAAVEGDEDAWRSGVEDMLEAADVSDDAELRTLVDDVRSADQDAAVASTLVDLANDCE